jgi:hypothetical protein
MSRRTPLHRSAFGAAWSAITQETTMADDLKQTGQDRKRINLNEDYEVRDWTQSLGVTEDELRHAVAAVGDRADDVRAHLGKK